MSATAETPEVTNIRRHNGVAGQYSYTATVTYPGEGASTVTFVSSVYGAPIVMVTPSGMQTFVATEVLDRAGRTLDPAWVRRFFDGTFS